MQLYGNHDNHRTVSYTHLNPVYYAQYAHARMCSIERQAAQAGIEMADHYELLVHEKEDVYKRQVYWIVICLIQKKDGKSFQRCMLSLYVRKMC